ncbi:MAG TPA: adenosine-specific kinase [Bryobacteraceae bacterium]|nr:adenosine-specific kinase [Bryobacteraceae bacterium]
MFGGPHYSGQLAADLRAQPLNAALSLLRYAVGSMELKTVPIELPKDGNIILGQSHFIKTAEDLYEALVNTVPHMKFGVAFNEASGPCLTRVEGNDEELKALAARNAIAIAAGHIFVIAMREGYPINVLSRIKDVPEVCSIFCATANPVEVVIAENTAGRGVLGVIDGASPKGVETTDDVRKRHEFLRKIGYKR